MHPCSDLQSDARIISMLAKNDKDAWAHLYDKYAPMMYGIVLNMAENKIVAAAILREIFWELQAKKMLSQVQKTLCHSLIRHTHKLTIAYLKLHGSTPNIIQPLNGDYPLVNDLYLELATINEIGNGLGKSKHDILVDLRIEFNRFRNQERQVTQQ